VSARLSTCAVCRGTVKHEPGVPIFGGWKHVTPGLYLHRPEPDDGAVSGPGDDDSPHHAAADAAERGES
jgi:hypothetical protein